VCKVFIEVIITSILKGFAVISKIGESYQICYLNSVLKHRKAIKAEIIRSKYLKRPICARCSQWSTGLGFDGLLQKACPVVGLSRLMDKPIAKCGICDRESSGSQILVDYM
jgi:hypothetical protein